MEITMIIDAEESLSIFWSVEFKTTKCIDFVQLAVVKELQLLQTSIVPQQRMVLIRWIY